MPLLRYALALSLYALVAAAGFALTAYGLTFIIGSAYILTQIWRGLDNAPPLSFLAQHYGLYGGITALGAWLVTVGVRAGVRRIRAGLPTDDEGIGKTAGSRSLSAMIYGAGFLFSTLSLAVSAVPGSQMALLVSTGVTVEARVLGFTPSPDDPRIYLMNYHFTTKTGQTVTDSMPTEAVDEAPSPNLMRTVEVTYQPANPQEHAVTRYYSHSSFIFFLVTRVAIVLVGAWGLMKNLAPPAEPPKGAPHRAAPIVPPGAPLRGGMPVAPVSPAAPRPTFGRRGT